MVFHRGTMSISEKCCEPPESPRVHLILLYCAKPTKHNFLFSRDADHRPSNRGISSLHPNFLEKRPAGFRTMDSVVGDAIWPYRTH